MSKKRKLNENYLDNKPLRNPEFKYTTDDKGGVTIEVENKGLMNRIFQIFFKKPSLFMKGLQNIFRYLKTVILWFWKNKSRGNKFPLLFLRKNFCEIYFFSLVRM